MLTEVPTPLFSNRVIRRRRYQLIGTLAGGFNLTEQGGATGSVIIGTRVGDVFEVGAGLRQMATPVQSVGSSREYTFEHLALVRLGLHFELDSRRIVSLPFSVDLGTNFGDVKQAKLNLGLRFNITPYLSLGIYPFSPVYTFRGANSVLADNSRWSFPSTLELGFNF
ncbi:MAG: hypothetical protein JRH20_19280 [Deltaproteobacteria bacterium]|nr:hypothetical protein [Deltaproteobacteria bacterium]